MHQVEEVEGEGVRPRAAGGTSPCATAMGRRCGRSCAAVEAGEGGEGLTCGAT
jgi:hypothetical protein